MHAMRFTNWPTRVMMRSSSSAMLLFTVARALRVPHRCSLITAAASDTAATGNFELSLFSPAKISLFTRVLGRREDGCHDVASMSQTVDLGDRLRLARIPGNSRAAAGVVRPSRKTEPIKQHVELSITPSDGSVPLDESNMVVRAIALYRSRLAMRDGGSLDVPRFRAHLVKHIPTDAGLCGASSNAATALWGANELCGRPASTAELIEWSRELGSEVACFLAGRGTSMSSGRAVFHKPEGVDPLAAIALPRCSDGEAELFLILPTDEQLSTPRLFRLLSDDNYSSLSQAAPEELVANLTASVGPSAASHVNDLEPPALQCSRTLDALKHTLLEDEGFDAAIMSGAGPLMFARGPPREVAFAERFPTVAAQTLGISVQVWPASFVCRSDADGSWY